MATLTTAESLNRPRKTRPATRGPLAGPERRRVCAHAQCLPNYKSSFAYPRRRRESAGERPRRSVVSGVTLVCEQFGQHDMRDPIGLGDLTDGAKGLMIDAALDLDVVAGQEAY